MADNTFVNIGGHKVSAGVKYSTTEVKTGDVWINGKPIYRKTWDLTLTKNSTSSAGRVLWNVDYVDDDLTMKEIPIKYYGVLKFGYNYSGTTRMRYLAIGGNEMGTSVAPQISTELNYIPGLKNVSVVFAYVNTLANMRADDSGVTATVVMEYYKSTD